MLNKEMIRLLIDPSFSQFIKKDHAQLIKLEKWPSDNLDENTIFNLVKYGMVKINHLSFNNYLNSFGEGNIDINLEDYFLSIKMNRKK